MRKDFDLALNFIMKAEGQISSHVADPGGTTIWGISERYYPDLVRQLVELFQAGRHEQIQRMVHEFYLHQWQVHRFYYLPFPISVLTFDFFVNTGKRAIFTLQRVLRDFSYRNICVDGIIGEQTSDAVVDSCLVHSHFYVGQIYTLQRVRYYANLGRYRRFRQFFRGWINRALDCLDFCWAHRDLVFA